MKEARGATPPCGECRKDPIEENTEAFEIWDYVRNQLIMTGMGDVLDIDFNAVAVAIDMLEVRDKRGCFRKVVQIARMVQDLQRKKEHQPG